MGYTLYLASQGANWGGASGTTADLVWNINWDELFNKENLKVENRTVQVRYRLVSQSLEDLSGTQITAQQRSGWLSCSLQAANEKTNIGYQQFGGSVLGQLTPNVIAWISAPGATSGRTMFLKYESSTMSDVNGVEVLTPSGVSQFRVQMLRHQYPLTPANPEQMVPSVMSYGQDYTLVLDFDFR